MKRGAKVSLISKTYQKRISVQLLNLVIFEIVHICCFSIIELILVAKDQLIVNDHFIDPLYPIFINHCKSECYQNIERSLDICDSAF